MLSSRWLTTSSAAPLASTSTSTRIRGGDALLAEARSGLRTGEMLDIVATIQAEQDEIILGPTWSRRWPSRAAPVPARPLSGCTGRLPGLQPAGPEPGEGVLVLGPSRAFLRYIAQVLPALGEDAVVQTTISGIAPGVPRAVIRARTLMLKSRERSRADAPHGRSRSPGPRGASAPALLEHDVFARPRFDPLHCAGRPHQRPIGRPGHRSPQVRTSQAGSAPPGNAWSARSCTIVQELGTHGRR